MNYLSKLLTVAAATTTLALVACGGEAQRQEQHSIALEGATAVSVHLTMDDGALDIAGGSDTLMEAEIAFPEDNPPTVAYAVDGELGSLDLFQDSDRKHLSSFVDNRWNLAFNEDVPLSMAVEMDDGDADLELGGLLLEQLDFTTDIGDATIDLAGEPRIDLTANVEVDNGRVKLRLPGKAAARISVEMGNGDIEAPGFARDGTGAYVREGAVDAPFYDVTVQIDNGELEVEVVN